MSQQKSGFFSKANLRGEAFPDVKRLYAQLDDFDPHEEHDNHGEHENE